MQIATFWVEVRLALYVFALSLVIGYITGHLALFISIGLLAFIIWHLRQIMQLHRWLMSGAPRDTTPNLYGSAYQIITQICDLKKAHKGEIVSLQRTLAKFDSATKAMPDAMLIVDQMQNIEWANPAAKTLLKIDATRDIGQRVDNIVRDPEITRMTSRLESSRMTMEKDCLSCMMIETCCVCRMYEKNLSRMLHMKCEHH